jgi:hypothetical protein
LQARAGLKRSGLRAHTRAQTGCGRPGPEEERRRALGHRVARLGVARFAIWFKQQHQGLSRLRHHHQEFLHASRSTAAHQRARRSTHHESRFQRRGVAQGGAGTRKHTSSRPYTSWKANDSGTPTPWMNPVSTSGLLSRAGQLLREACGSAQRWVRAPPADGEGRVAAPVQETRSARASPASVRHCARVPASSQRGREVRRLRSESARQRQERGERRRRSVAVLPSLALLPRDGKGEDTKKEPLMRQTRRSGKWSFLHFKGKARWQKRIRCSDEEAALDDLEQASRSRALMGQTRRSGKWSFVHFKAKQRLQTRPFARIRRAADAAQAHRLRRRKNAPSQEERTAHRVEEYVYSTRSDLLFEGGRKKKSEKRGKPEERGERERERRRGQGRGAEAKVSKGRQRGLVRAVPLRGLTGERAPRRPPMRSRARSHVALCRRARHIMSFDELASDEYDAIVKPKEAFEQKYKKKLPVVFGPITDKNVEQVASPSRAMGGEVRWRNLGVCDHPHAPYGMLALRTYRSKLSTARFSRSSTTTSSTTRCRSPASTRSWLTTRQTSSLAPSAVESRRGASDFTS